MVVKDFMICKVVYISLDIIVFYAVDLMRE